jgi:ATP-dependent 26S proteasome regulatory subunit
MSTAVVDPGVMQSLAVIFDAARPLDARVKLFRQILMSALPNQEQADKLLRSLLVEHQGIGELAKVELLRAEYEQALEELKNGPPRPATFIAAADGEMPGPQPRAHVVTADGVERFPFLQESVSLIDLEPGMTVYLDYKGATVIGASRTFPRAGNEAEYRRSLPESGCVEAVFQDQQYVLYASQSLLTEIAAGRVRRGDLLLWNPRMMFAFAAIPAEEDRKFRFVDDTRIPDLDIAREIGRPHPILRRLIRRTRILLARPDILERFDLRPRYSVFLTGPSGTGKTLTIKAYLSAYQRMIRDYTGRDDIGSRVIRVKATTLLSEWFGVSERKIEELFDDIIAVASEEFEVHGRRQKLPVVVIFEEAEGLLRKRSGGDGRAALDGDVYSRVLGTLLARLDDPNDDLSRLPIIWLTTSNLAMAVDSAAWRRLCHERADFRRLDREGCIAVLSKKLRPQYPYSRNNGTPPDLLRRETLQQVIGWLYSPNGEDQGQVELTFRDGKRQTKYRRDFLTGSIIDQAVAQAVSAAAEECEATGDDAIGLNAERIIAALREIIDGLADNITPDNAGDYLDVPDHVTIASVRRLRESRHRLLRMAR